MGAGSTSLVRLHRRSVGMTVIDTLLRRLEDEQAEHSKQALSMATNRTEFGYGQVVGMYAGLERAKELILSMLEAAERDDDRL